MCGLFDSSGAAGDSSAARQYSISVESESLNIAADGENHPVPKPSTAG
jgi:hypothetical protein